MNFCNFFKIFLLLTLIILQDCGRKGSLQHKKKLSPDFDLAVDE